MHNTIEIHETAFVTATYRASRRIDSHLNRPKRFN